MKAGALAALVVLLAACGSAPGGGSQVTPSPSATVSPSQSPSPTSAPSPSPIASPSPAPSDACFPKQGGTSSRATITDVRVGSHTGYDRLVIEFAGGMPAYKLVPQDPSSFVGPFSGLPVSVAGNAGIHLFIYNMDIPPSYQHGANQRPGYRELVQVVVMAVFEGQADIAIGLDRPVCPQVSIFSSPTRLVIDFPTQ